RRCSSTPPTCCTDPRGSVGRRVPEERARRRSSCARARRAGDAGAGTGAAEPVALLRLDRRAHPVGHDVLRRREWEAAGDQLLRGLGLPARRLRHAAAERLHRLLGALGLLDTLERPAHALLELARGPRALARADARLEADL